VRYKLYPPDPVLIYSSPKHHCTAAIDLVTGAMTETDCYAMRHRWGACGPDAKLFEDAPANGETTAAPLLPVEQGIREGLKALLVGLGALALLALAFWVYEHETYEHETHQPTVIQTGDVSQMREVSVKDGSSRVTARTRLLSIGERSLWQVEVSPGDWRDCGGDCEKALRRALAE
jgi:hypothetical protein